MESLLYPLLAAFCVSLVSFVGVILIPLGRVKKIIPLLVAFAAGGMIGDVFLHLLPQAIEESAASIDSTSFIWLIVGIVCFYLLETLLHWHHHHNYEDSNKPHHISIMAIAGDVLHNFFDGLGIAAAFAINPAVGIATTFAFIVHEIPQELGDFAIFINSGWSKRKALLANFLSGLFSVFGAIAGVFLLQQLDFIKIPIVMLTAGSLIYIALADLIPEGNKENMKHHKTFRFWVLLSFIFGVGLMYGFTFLEHLLDLH